MNLPNLDQTVNEALTFFESNPPQRLNLDDYNLPFVVGSGNAINAGQIIFSQKAALFADESNFKSLVESYKPIIAKGLISQAIIISASGEKDSVWETELANKIGLKTTLLTCKPNSSAAKLADKVFAYKSIAEPYTYNTSTYLGMILSTTNEDPKEIKELIGKIEFPKSFAEYQSYAFILPDKYLYITPMIDIKGDELFGPHLTIRACSYGHARHAKFVYPWEKELVISIGEKNEYFGLPEHRWDIGLPKSASFGTVMALSYYLCGKIQGVKTPYFKENIAKFCQDYGPKAYGKNEVFEVIVPANS